MSNLTSLSDEDCYGNCCLFIFSKLVSDISYMYTFGDTYPILFYSDSEKLLLMF